MNELQDKKGLLGWFASNHVAANLLMVMIIVAGLMALTSAKLEVFPEMSLDMITITVPYLGATPEDVESGVCLRIEEAIASVEGIKRITANASEGFASIIVEIEEYADTTKVLDDVKSQIDNITTLPQETEKPIIAELKTTHSVINVVVSGDASEKTLKTLAEQIRNDLTGMENISQASITGVRPYEISIEIPEETLRRYNLTFNYIAQRIRESSLDIPAGSIETASGEILVRTKGQKYFGREFGEIIILTRNDGTELKLNNIAAIKDNFEDIDQYCGFDGERAALIQVSRTGDQDALDIARTVKKYVKEKQSSMPEGISLGLWQDDTDYLRARLDLLTRNAYLGLILVFICLTLFLNMRLAFWTTMGIPVSFLGAFYLIPHFDVSINMMSLFAFIMCLGLVVDDAIVIGENIFAYREQGLGRTEAAIKGVREMAMPVTLAVLTTMFTFVPLGYTLGIMGKILRVIPIVVISVLGVSLIEALLILPAHLSSQHSWNKYFIVRITDRINKVTHKGLDWFINGPLVRSVERAVKWRYVTLAAGIAIFLVTIGIIAGGYIKFVFFDSVEADNLVAELKMPLGTPYEQTEKNIKIVEQAAFDIISEFDKSRPEKQSVMKHMATTIGSLPTASRGGPVAIDGGSSGQSHLAEINIELLGAEYRDISSVDIGNKWREKVGEIPGVSSLTFTSEFVMTGNAIEIELSHDSFDVLLKASERFQEILRNYAGITDIADDFEPGKPELKLQLKETGLSLGLTLSDLARKIRQAFYGEEIQRVQRGRDDIRVMLRYPEQNRKSINDIENIRIRLLDGTEIPFKTIADVQYGRGYSNIRRVDRRRVVSVSANVDEAVANSKQLNKIFEEVELPKLMKEFPGLQYRFAGEQREIADSLGSLIPNFSISLLAIFALLAVQFRSYWQPLIVMSAIPFGIIGAVIGHLVMGYNLGLLSMFGIVALSGIVVNDSLIMIDLINRERDSGIELTQIIHDSATRRFRPIMLTTLTTFCGLLPMITEKSLQARFLIPMAISLAFGVMFATCITLLLVPSLYMILEDIKKTFLSDK